MNVFRDWYIRNQDAITWFLIGWLTFAGIEDLSDGKYFWAAFNFAFAYLNFKLRSIRLS
jgi:hypothetical protein